MRASQSLRLRLAIGIAALAVLVVSVHSAALYLTTEAQEEEQIDRVVSEEVQAFVDRYRADPASLPPRSHNLSGYVARTAAEQAALPKWLQGLTVGAHEVYPDGGELHIAVRELGATRLYLVYDVSHHEQQLREFVWLLGFGVLATALAAAVLGYLLAGFLTQPVSELAARVAGLAPDRPPPEPLAPRYAEREVHALAEAFDHYTARIADFIRREQAFTADVSHELRTPLTAIRTSCELLVSEPGLGESARERLARIARAAARMEEVIKSLLLLARAGQPPEREVLALHALVEQAAEELGETLSARAIELRNEVPPEVTLHADRTALVLVLANLLRNATNHTAAGWIAVRWRAGALEIEDSGQGIAPEDLPHVFERHYRGRNAPAGTGHGLGLALVKRLADGYGWALALESEPGRGTRVRLTLTP